MQICSTCLTPKCEGWTIDLICYFKSGVITVLIGTFIFLIIVGIILKIKKEKDKTSKDAKPKQNEGGKTNGR